MAREVHWVYALTEPFTHAVRYVGCSTEPLERMRLHMWSNNRHNPELTIWVKRCRKDNGCPGLILLEKVSPSGDHCERERWWIAKYHNDGCELFNKSAKPGHVRPTQECWNKSIAAKIRAVCEQVGWNASVEEIQQELGTQIHHFGECNMKVNEHGNWEAIWPGKPYPVPLSYIRKIRSEGPKAIRVVSGT